MMQMTRTTVLATVLATLACLLGAARASAGDDAARSWSAQLGKAPTADAVATALHETATGEGDAVALARALGCTRGIEAVRGLEALLERRQVNVRIEAMLSLARIGLRSDCLAEALHKRLADSYLTKRERLVAVVALGAVGDGRDVTLLLGFASKETQDHELRAAAFRALTVVTKTRIPFVHARWSYWWRKYEARAADRIEKAVAALEAAPKASEATRHEAVLSAYGWADLETLSEVLTRWLRGSRQALQAAACRLAAHHRMADLAPAIVALGKDRRAKDAVRDASGKAANSLGVAAAQPAR